MVLPTFTDTSKINAVNLTMPNPGGSKPMRRTQFSPWKTDHHHDSRQYAYWVWEKFVFPHFRHQCDPCIGRVSCVCGIIFTARVSVRRGPFRYQRRIGTWHIKLPTNDIISGHENEPVLLLTDELHQCVRQDRGEYLLTQQQNAKNETPKYLYVADRHAESDQDAAEGEQASTDDPAAQTDSNDTDGASSKSPSMGQYMASLASVRQGGRSKVLLANRVRFWGLGSGKTWQPSCLARTQIGQQEEVAYWFITVLELCWTFSDRLI
jgi:hypothetical protein